MNGHSEPFGGHSLRDAFRMFTDVEKLRAFDAANQRALPFRVRGPIKPGRNAALNALNTSNRAAIADFIRRLESGELVAWGSEGSPLSERKRIWREAWPSYSVIRWPEGEVETRDHRSVIYGVRVYTKAEVEDSANGLPLSRLGELTNSDVWKAYIDNFPYVLAVGDPESDAMLERFWPAQRFLHGEILSLVADGKIELCTLFPLGDPRATWTAISHSLLSTMEAGDLDLQDSKVTTPTGQTYQVRAFRPSANRNASPGSTNQGENPQSEQRGPVKQRIAEVWETLNESQKVMAMDESQKTPIVKVMRARLSDVNPATVDREFRRFIRDLTGN